MQQQGRSMCCIFAGCSLGSLSICCFNHCYVDRLNNETILRDRAWSGSNEAMNTLETCFPVQPPQFVCASTTVVAKGTKHFSGY